jgi:serpin B
MHTIVPILRPALAAVVVGLAFGVGVGVARAGGPEPQEGREKGGGVVSTATDKAEKAVVAGNTRFALDLYARLRAGQGNLFFSPYSLSTALAMTGVGARGDTAKQMAETLHFPADPAELHAGFCALIDRINGEGEQPSRLAKLLSANALWLQTGEEFLPDFLAIARDKFHAGLNDVDFVHDAEGARKTINGWVERQTQDKIRDLIPPKLLNRDTSLVLTNAVYFKAAWQSPFRESATVKDDKFTTTDGRIVPVPMMKQSHLLAYFDGGTFQMLDLPYARDEMSMCVLLPKKADGLAELEQSLTEARLSTWIGKLTQRQVDVELPRFKLTEGFNLRDVLVSMGMPLAFDIHKADFSGLTGKRNHAISEVVHKAFVDVNEQGTEAAAATAVVMQRAMAMLPKNPVKFRADHPFLFLIREPRTGTILFLGRLEEPKA